jgi:LuxR family maltose regulon positive regulatory protein
MASQAQQHVYELARPATGLPFDVVPGKLRVPVSRPGSISRTALVNRLRAARPWKIVTLVAPAGYGKTTVLAQWSTRDDRPFAWVSVDERDEQPIVLLRHLAAALHAIEPLAPAVLRALQRPGDSIWGSALPRLAGSLASLPSPCVIVLDNAAELRSEESAAVLAALVDDIPAGSTLVLTGRSEPRAPLAALRAAGELFEVGTDLLALGPREAEQLVRATGIELPARELAELLERTEGWPAGLYLAALAAADGGAGDFGGDDRYLADYFRSACLDGLDPERLAFLRRTAALERISGPLCDAVLDRTGSAIELETAEADSLFLVPLDRRRNWYRYHALFRDLLRRELEQHEPGASAELNGRAADWFESEGEPESAIACAAAADDPARVARLIGSIGLGVFDRGGGVEVEGWLEHFESQCDLREYPEVAAIGAWVHACSGHESCAERWLTAAGDGGGDTRPPWLALVRAAFCRDGASRMLDDAAACLAALPPESPWLPTALFVHASALLLLGDDVAADAGYAEAAARAETLSATGVRIAALSQRALIAFAGDDLTAAEALALEARELASGDAVQATAVLEHAAMARVLLRRSRFDDARAELAAARGLESMLTPAIPWLAVQARVELARAHIALRDTVEARALLAEAARIIALRPDLGTLAAQAEALAAKMDALEQEGGRVSGLTGAELRLIPLLATHLSFREIGDRLHLSRHTVKTQAISTYRKLGVSSRSDAVERVVGLGLVDAVVE